MDWPNFISYLVILANICWLSVRLGEQHRHAVRIESKLSFVVFVETMRLQGMTEGEIAAKLTEMGQEAKAEMAFAQIAREETKPWWRKKLGR